MKNQTLSHALPLGILKSDLKPPKNWRDQAAEFELWYTERFGWVIPTLLIRYTRRFDVTRRTYAVGMNGETYCVGHGPHIKETLRVHVTKQRAKALSRFLTLRETGIGAANNVRDRISSRRAQTALRRSLW